MSAVSLKSGGRCRSLEEMRRIVETAGGRITWSKVVAEFPDNGSGWYAIHIVR